MTGPEVTQPDPDGGVEMTDGEWAAFRGAEVTTATKAEDVDAGLVEKVAEVIEGLLYGLGGPGSRAVARRALAAAIPEVRAQALRDAAFEWQTREWTNVPRRADRVADRLGAAQHVCNWLRERAARLTATTEEPTDGLPEGRAGRDPRAVFCSPDARG